MDEIPWAEGVRNKGEPMDEYLRRKQYLYQKITDLDHETTLPDDLYAYSMIEGTGCTRASNMVVWFTSVRYVWGADVAEGSGKGPRQELVGR